jgi:hypothetical protein
MSAATAANRPTTISLAKVKMQDLNRNNLTEATATTNVTVSKTTKNLGVSSPNARAVR